MILRAVLASLLVLASARALAQPRVPVELEAGEDDPLARRLRAELGARGYDVSSRAPDAPEQDASERASEVLARRVGGYVRVSETRAEVCARRVPDGALRCEPVDRSAGDDLVVLTVVEILRARLLGASTEAPEPEPPVVVAPPAPEPEPPRSTLRFELELALGTTIPFDGATPSLDSRIALGVAIDPTWSVRAWGRLPWIAERVDAPEGAADLRAHLVGLEVAASIDVGSPWAIELGALAAGGWLEAIGDAVSGVDDANVTAPLFLAGAHASIALGVLDALALALRASVGWSVPTPVVRFGARDVARYGAPFVAVDLVARARVP